MAEYSAPFRGDSSSGEGLWYTQDASGNQYLWTDSGWVDPYSTEGQEALADPSAYAAGVIVQSGDYWYSQDNTTGQQYLWTGSEWSATTATTGADPSVAVVGGTSSGVSDGLSATNPASTVVGPPTAGDSQADLLAQLTASGDPAAAGAAQQIQESSVSTAETWSQPDSSEGYETSTPGDHDRDGMVYGTDPDDYDSTEQTSEDFSY